jgi:hypothetical protein
MRIQILPAALALACYAQALLTLQTMRNLTEITEECRERIVGAELDVVGEVDGMARVLMGVEDQTVLRGGHDEDEGEDEGEVEDVSFSFFGCLAGRRGEEGARE